MSDIEKIEWTPGPDFSNCRLRQFLDFCGVEDMAALHDKTAADPAWFWGSAIKFLDVQFYEP